MASDPVDPLRIGEEFQARTKYDRRRMQRGAPWPEPVADRKQYAESLPRVALPPPQTADGAGLWDAVRARRSARAYGRRALSAEELSQLLWATQGVTAEHHGYRFRAAPSAGALYPIETYLAINSVDAIAPGVYHYEVAEHALVQVSAGDCRADVSAGALDQAMCAEAAVVFIWSATVGRCAQKYAQRAYRYIYLDAGHIAAHLSLACAAMDLGACRIAALFDDEMNRIVGADGHDETVIYMTTVGPLQH